MDNKNNNQSNTPSTKRVFDTEAYKCGTFLEKLNNCNSVYSYKDGNFFRREPYSYVISNEQYLMQKGSIVLPDYRYENGKRVGNGLKRKYEAGKVYDKSKQNAS